MSKGQKLFIILIGDQILFIYISLAYGTKFKDYQPLFFNETC